MTKNILNPCYDRLSSLKYSEENIAELFSILNKIIDLLKSIEPDRIQNKCLHFVLLTKEREFEELKRADKNNLKQNFENAKSCLYWDLNIYCDEYCDS